MSISKIHRIKRMRAIKIDEAVEKKQIVWYKYYRYKSSIGGKRYG